MPIMMKQDCYGLRYKPDEKERKKQMKSKREKRMVSLEGRGMEGKPILFPHLYETFRSTWMEHNDT